MRVLFVLIIFLVTSCSPTVNSKIAIPSVKVPTIVAGLKKSSNFVFVDEFKDARPKAALVDCLGKQSLPDGDLTLEVVRVVKEALEEKGFMISDTAPVVLSGEVRKWHANVTGGFQGKIDSEASIYVEVLDPANKRIYSGIYSGVSSLETPNVDEKDMRESLGAAMTAAIEQFTKDQQLAKLISSF